MSRNRTRKIRHKAPSTGGFFILIGLPIILATLIYVGFNIKESWLLGNNKAKIEFIAQHYNTAGELVDYTNELDMIREDPIRLFVKDEKVTLQFGNVKMVWKMQDFISEENRKDLARIYVTMYRDRETGKLRVFYKDQEVQRWVS